MDKAAATSSKAMRGPSTDAMERPPAATRTRKSASRFHITAILVTVMGLLACDFKLPRSLSGTVTTYSPGVPAHPSALTKDQLQALDEWFGRHVSGWSSSPATYVPVLIVRIQHSGGSDSVVNVMSTMIVVNGRDGQHVRQLPHADLEALRDNVSSSYKKH